MPTMPCERERCANGKQHETTYYGDDTYRYVSYVQRNRVGWHRQGYS